MNKYTRCRNVLCGLVFVGSLFAVTDSYAWHGWHHGGWGYHHGGWGHHGYWGRGYGWGGVGYYGAGAGCRWVGAHWNRWGAWVPAHRACW